MPLTDKQYGELKYLAASPGWAVIKDYLEGRIRAAQADLERQRFGNLADVAYLQGQIAGLKTALDYPGTRIAEYEKKRGED